ncbi:MAG: integrase, partial [Candidatus Microthrix parvicella]
MSLIAPTLESFFTDRLVKQQHASPATIGSYRDSLRMLLTYAQEHTGKTPARLDWADLDETMISG